MAGNHLPKEYELHISTNDLRKASADAASALYEWLDTVSPDVGDEEDEESDFELFARDVMDAIGRHPEELSYGEESERYDEDVSASEFQ